MSFMCTMAAPRLDIRAKLAVVALAGLVSVIVAGRPGILAPVVMALPVMLHLRQWRPVALLAGAMPLLWGGYVLLAQLGGTAGGLAAYLCYFGLKVAPLAALFAAIGATSMLGDLLGALTCARLPRDIVLAMAVTCRFVPTLCGEYACIRDAMAVRGVRTGLYGLLTRPLKQVEYILLPLMMRATRLADELSASAMTRGVEAPGSLRRDLPPWGRAEFVAICWATLVGAGVVGGQMRELMQELMRGLLS